MSNYVGRKFISKDGYKCKIVRDIDEKTDIAPSKRRYEVQFEDGTLKVYKYKTLRLVAFVKNRTDNYIGKEFISSDGYKCKVIRDLDWNTDIVPCKRRYEVQFEDETLATYNYHTLHNRNFNKTYKNVNYIGKEFISKDGYKCKIVRDLDENTNKQPSQRRYEVEFEDSMLAIYSYGTLRGSDFNRKNLNSFIGKEFISSDGYKCKIVRDLDENRDKNRSKHNYKVRFEDGTLATYTYVTLLTRGFRKESVITYIGREFTSSDGYKCKIVRDIDENTDITPSKRYYEVQFEDGTLATYNYKTLRDNTFKYANITYIGKKFMSTNGYECKIVRDLDENTDIVPSQRRYEVQFEDGVLAIYNYQTLINGSFKRYIYIGRKFISSDGYKCKIIRDVDKETTKPLSRRRCEVQFEDGILATYTYNTLRSGRFKRPKYFTERIDKETGYKLNECALCKLALIMPLDTRVLHLRIHHGINVDKDSELL